MKERAKSSWLPDRTGSPSVIGMLEWRNFGKLIVRVDA